MVVEKFEIGKWYKYNHHDDVYYIKVLSKTSRNISGNSLTNKLYAKHDSWDKNSLAGSNSIELKDLTEIQKYLPDNHPDKFNKIVELW